MDNSPRRRDLLRSLVPATVAIAGCSGGDSSGDGESDPDASSPTDGGTADPGEPTTAPESDGPTGPPSVSLAGERLADGLVSPTDAVPAGDGRLLVAEQVGVVRLVADGLREEPYLDIRDRVVDVSGFTEQGLLGLEPHPSFPENGRLFVRYSAPPREGTPDGYSHTFVLAAFEADADGGDPDSEQTLLEIPEPQFNHNSGDIVFGPDGYLYVGVGDGGGADDTGTGHVEDWYEPNSGGNGQDVTENLLGSVLRIDVEGSERIRGERRSYAVPEDNPLVGTEGLPEHFAWGFRNPWGMSFGPEGSLFVADVGQDAYEEVDVVRRGGNYGWNVREGTHCFREEECPSETPDGDPLIDPIIEYPHEGAEVSGISVIGGYVYEGDAVPDLRGRYVFSDWRAGGELFVATPNGDTDPATAEWSVVPVPAEGVGPMVTAFAVGGDDELLVCTSESGQVDDADGAVYRLGPG